MGVRTLAVVIALLAGPLLVACGDDDAAVGAGGGGSPVSAGDYVSVEVTGAPRPLVAGTSIALRFDDGQLGAHAGCNHLGGEYRFDGDTLVVGQMGGTEMGCPPELHDQDRWLTDLLTSSPTVAVADDGFTLTAGATQIRFVDRDVAEPDAELVGTRWVVTGFVDGETAMSTTAGTDEAFLAFGDDGYVTGHDGCNGLGWGQQGDDPSTRLGLRYEVGDGEITFDGAPAQTLKGCADEVQDAVERFRAVLAGTVSFEIEGSNLTLLAPDGRGVTYSAPS